MKSFLKIAGIGICILIGIVLLVRNVNWGLATGPQYEAVKKGDVQYLKNYLERGGDINIFATGGDIGPAAGWNLLMSAAQAGQIEVMKLLIDHGADVNARTSRWDTPLIAAIKAGQVEAVRWLIGHGAMVDMQALQELVYAGHDFRTSSSTRTSRHNLAPEQARAKMLIMLLDAGVPVDSHSPNSSNNRTPLSYAIEFGHVEIAKILLDYGADKQKALQGYYQSEQRKKDFNLSYPEKSPFTYSPLTQPMKQLLGLQ